MPRPFWVTRDLAQMARKPPLRPLIAVIGATGTGKSQLAVELAVRFNGEVINADAMQMYEGLDVITNKMPEIDRKGVPHHLLGSIGLDQDPWTVGNFTRSALDIIKEIRSRGRLPIVVGGTHYYTQSLLFHDSLSNTISVTDHTKAEATSGSAEHYSILDRPTPELLDKLREVDQVMADRWHPNDRRKIQRSLEIYLKTGRRASDIYESQRLHQQASGVPGHGSQEVGLEENTSHYDTNNFLHNGEDTNTSAIEPKNRLRFESLVFWVHAVPDVLRSRLESRVERMLKSGLVVEVESLQAYIKSQEKGHVAVDQTRGIFASIGYKEFVPYVTALASTNTCEEELEAIKNEAILQTKRSTTRYAKQQLRWIRIKLLNLANESGLSRTLFLLDGSGLPQWSATVEGPASSIVQAFLEGQDVPNPSSLSSVAMEMLVAKRNYDLSDRRDLWTKGTCEICGTTLVNPNDWGIHTQSRGHRRRSKKLEKRSKGIAKDELPLSASE